MRLRPALVGTCAAALIVAATPATAADGVADLTLVVTSGGAAQVWSRTAAPVGAGPELVGGSVGECPSGAVVDVDPAARTISVTVPRTADGAEVALTVSSDVVGGVTAVTPGLADLTMTVTPEIAIVTWRSPASADCAAATAVFGYTAPGQPMPAQPQPPLVEVAPAGPGTSAPGAAPAAAVVADPSFTG